LPHTSLEHQTREPFGLASTKNQPQPSAWKRPTRAASSDESSAVSMALGWVGGTALGHALPLTPRGPLAVAAAFLPLAFIVALLPTQGAAGKASCPERPPPRWRSASPPRSAPAGRC
jgi:hypothetical protein